MADTSGTAAPETLPETDGDGVRRRDFINIAAISAAGVGGIATLVPLLSQMWPSADVLAESSTDVDLSAIQPGQAIKAVFRKQPLFVRNLTQKEIAEAADPQAALDARVAEYTEKFANPYIAAARGYVDDVIDPRDTRPRLIEALEALRGKRDRNPPKKHGNLPL